jgi:3-phenylpropionate/cinnamic acid dioxygenase small subunit
MDTSTCITNLIYRYGALVDAGDYAGIGRLLADAVVTDASGRLELRGADAVRQLYERSTRLHPETGTPRTKHIITNPIVEIDETAGCAHCVSQYVVYQQTDTLPLQAIVSGRYEHAFVRVDGAWRITSHRFFVDQVGDVSQHLLLQIR